MDSMLALVPIYGSLLTYEQLSDESIPFPERAVIAATAGFTAAAQIVVVDRVTGRVPSWTRHVVQKGPAAGAVAALAGLTYATTKKGADVEIGPHGSVRITPKLGLF